jgi:hypothetical protein
MDHFGLVPFDGFGKSIAIEISDAARRSVYLTETYWTASVAVVHETATMDRPSIMQCLL